MGNYVTISLAISYIGFTVDERIIKKVFLPGYYVTNIKTSMISKQTF